MANMSYCRFENTYRDLLDCKEALAAGDGIEAQMEEAGERERPFVRDLVALCKEITMLYGEELEALESKGTRYRGRHHQNH